MHKGLELLKSIKDITTIINNMEEEVVRLYSRVTSTTIKPKEVDVQTSLPQDKMGDSIADIVEYQSQLDEYVKQLCKKKTKALNVIKCMEASEQSLILLRYFKVMTLEKIAEELDLSYYWTWKRMQKAEESFCNFFDTVDRS